SSVFECYEALFDPETDDWNQSVRDLYKDQIMGLDVLFIESIQLNSNYRRKGIGAQVVRETIATFGTHCGLITCKPFPLQYSNWEDEEHFEMRQQPGFEERSEEHTSELQSRGHLVCRLLLEKKKKKIKNKKKKITNV